MAVNKVEVGGETVLDLTTDTVSENNLLAGVTAHNAAGEPITGVLGVATPESDGLMSAEDKTKLDGIGGSSSSADVGDIKITACSNAPTGWLICDGSAISRADYSKLFNAIGTTYGTGNGSTTFNIPNLKGKVVVGVDTSDTSFSAIGKTGGEKAHSLKVSEIPSHNHISYLDISSAGTAVHTVFARESGRGPGTFSSTTSSTGGDAAHNNLQPYMALNYIIYTGVTE